MVEPDFIVSTSRRRWLVWLALTALYIMVALHEFAMLVLAAYYWGNDFSQYWSGANSVAAGTSPYHWVSEQRPLKAQDYHYPPLLALALTPLTHLVDSSVATAAWAAFGALCLILSVWLIAATMADSSDDAAGALKFSCLVLLPAATWGIGVGQLCPELLLLVVASAYAIQSRRSSVASVLIGAGACLKVFPVLLGIYFLARRQRRELLAMSATGAALTLLTLLVLGWQSFQSYLYQVIPSQQTWFTWEYNMSITGMFTRLLWHGAPSLPSDAPNLLTHIAVLFSCALIVASTLYAIRRHPRTPDAFTTQFSLIVVTTLLVSPINGNYNLILLALPLTVLAAGHGRLPCDIRYTFYLAVGLLSLPVEYCTLGIPNLCALLNGPILGQLLLWLVLLRLCLAQPRSPLQADDPAPPTPIHGGRLAIADGAGN